MAVLYIVINRKRRKSVIEQIKILNPQAFYTIEDLRFVNRELDFFINNKESDNKSSL
ncbi:MAG: DUF2179 domain-containing protein [Bacteroidales bacterium]|nr:DUF2179 domain-containing protein [Bacteroidales bacterium]